MGITLESFLDSFTNFGFYITVPGWCYELAFSDYPDEKKKPYWYKYRNREISGISLIVTNGFPEIIIDLKYLL